MTISYTQTFFPCQSVNMSTTYVLIILACLLILIGTITFKTNSELVFKESFDAPLLVYETEQLKDVVYMTEDIPQLSQFHWIKRDNKQPPQELYVHVDDVFTYDRNYKDDSIALCILNEEKSLFLTKKRNQRLNETLTDVLYSKGKFYCDSKTTVDLLKILVISIGEDPNIIQFEKDRSKAYCTVHFDNLEVFKHADEDIDFISFEDKFDIHKFKMHAPFCYLTNKDTTLYFSSMKNEKFPIKLFICFKLMLWIPIKNDIIPEYISKIIYAAGDVDDTNYFTIYFTFHDITLLSIKQINKLIKVRSSLPILEQFEEEKKSEDIDILPAQNIFGYYDADKKTLSIYEKMIDGIPLQIVSSIHLQNQVRSEENGYYKVLEISDEPSEKTILQKTASESDTHIEPEYQCIGDSTIKNKGLCNSVYDAMGRPKENRNVWDRPCVTNTDCPFYQINKNYDNYRGGCINGYCEMPLGVKRIGFTMYDGNPLCHSCPLSNPSCCEKQEYPDYAFELDFDERKDSLKIPK